MLDSPGHLSHYRRPEGPPDRGGPSLDDGPRRPRPAPRLILIERSRGGDLDAFNDLVSLYQDALFALVVRMVPDRDQAADAVQEAFFSAYRNLASFRGGSVKSWLNRICVNAAMDTQRRANAARSSPIRSSRTRLAAEGR